MKAGRVTGNTVTPVQDPILNPIPEERVMDLVQPSACKLTIIVPLFVVCTH